MSAHDLEDAHDVARFGGKAAGLARARRGGLPVPHARALSVEVVERIVAGEGNTVVSAVRAALRGPLAVRSSAVDEDSGTASFAGQHSTVLGVLDERSLVEAVREVHASAHTDAVRSYRARAGLHHAPRVAVLVQELLAPTFAGVMFTRDPRSGDARVIIECAWGLGESIVQGLVLPERWVLEGGAVVERDAGHKDVAVVHRGGRAQEEAVEPARQQAFCLEPTHIDALLDLARRADAIFGDDAHDIEWAWAEGAPWFLQRRPITTRFGGSR